MIKQDDIWKGLTKYRYSKQRNEIKFHTDFKIREGDKIKSNTELMKIFEKRVPKGKEWKIHFDMAVETFPKGR